MARTRQSSNGAADTNSSPKAQEKSSPKAGMKRKAEAAESPQSKRGRTSPKQQTLEESINNGNESSRQDVADQPGDIEMKEAAAVGEGTDKPVKSTPAEDKGQPVDDDQNVQANSSEKENAEQADEEREILEKTKKVEADVRSADTKPVSQGKQGSDEDAEASKDAAKEVSKDDGGVIEHASDREGTMPSNILEKGIIYFFTRGRVGVEEPDSVQDLQRTYFALRPIPKEGKIGEGALQDEKTTRLVALPKKVFPKSGRDRFMVFVEKSGVSMKDLKEDFFQGSEYDTKTVGTRQTPPVAPLGEGVYALTTTGRTSHLAYMMTIPKELNEVQTDMGLREKGSFVTSLKNPTVSGPSYASLPEKPEFPKEFIDDFQGRSWMPIEKPEYLDYPNAQLLLIGEGEDKFASALEPTDKDKKHDKETPQEELEKLENEDQIRVEHLRGDDTVFSDLGISKNEYPDVMTTW